jgi:DNA-binding response OmpR family regulator
MISHVHVLVVDDDPVITDLLGIHLERQGYTVKVASSAVDGEKFIVEDQYQLVVSDIEMPGLDGIEFLKRIREKQPGVGVIIMTAFPDNHPRTTALRAGADGYVRKPFNLNQFSNVLEKAYWNALTRADSLDIEQTL